MSDTAASIPSTRPDAPFAQFRAPVYRPDTPLRRAITAAYRVPEPECVPPLIAAARVSEAQARAIKDRAETIVKRIRARGPGGGIDGLIHEYALSSQEGIALMCLAEALLRTPDKSTRDALISDKIAPGDWQGHLGQDRSLFVNAATWGLVITGRLVSPVDDRSLSTALNRLLQRSGEPVVRSGVNMAMKMLGEQFVAGQTIEEAMRNGRRLEERGFRYSYDMLGEAATTAADSERYMNEYRTAIHAIGKASRDKGLYDGPGISIKLSALHPRYTRAQQERVFSELLPRLKELAALAQSYNVGLNIDAEEADRLEISLDLLEALATDPQFDGWHGIGFVVQAYQKRCPLVVDWLIDLARRTNHRLMIRLVKGAYWDSEIKRAQQEGLEDFPVYTRKVYSDVAFLACAKKLLDAREAVFPQFATHNAQSMSTVLELAGPDFTEGDYEFQCLHGMGEPLYNEVVGANKLGRPCRIYAPVGSHDTLLAYLVRRLLENGANSSFVNQIGDEDIPVARLVADPAEVASGLSPLGAPHEDIDLPRDILAGGRKNSWGRDLSNEDVLAALQASLEEASAEPWRATPVIAGEPIDDRTARPALNPADHAETVGDVIEPTKADVDVALEAAKAAGPDWAATAPAERAAIFERAADLMEARTEPLMAMAMREAGKSAANAVAEVREAVDFLRYYARQVADTFANDTHIPLGPVVCISPWNFPLAIFSGQVSAALVAGNTVIAKPAEETPLIARAAIEIFHEAGLPRAALQFLPGGGEIGAALVAHPQTCGVMFTGSVPVAEKIQAQLADRTLANGAPIPLVAETGGQNALVVDSSALTEQVVLDVLASGFDSAGQRCSALRLLCLQDDVADRTLEMLKGATAELSVGNTERLATDIGPVITAEARDGIESYIAGMEKKGFAVTRFPLPPECESGTFVAPTLIELNDVSDLGHEVFGPVIHVVRYKRKHLDKLIDRINALGYGLTFGLHTRIDTTMAQVANRIEVGNIYINRNQIGAVVGVQPFGGHGLSGTGPKAGGPLYLRRLVSTSSQTVWGLPQRQPGPTLVALADWAESRGEADLARRVLEIGHHPAINAMAELSGPVGERNTYQTRAKGRVLVAPKTVAGLVLSLAAALAPGNDIVLEAEGELKDMAASLPEDFAPRVRIASAAPGDVGAVLVEGDAQAITAMASRAAQWPGPIALVQGLSSERLAAGEGYSVDLLVNEVSTSHNTAAAGGNATLMAIA